MIDSLALANLCEAIYKPAGEFSSIVQSGEVYAGIAHIDNQTVIICRGSANVADWLHDLDAVPEYIDGIGTVHAGMWDGVEEFFGKLRLSGSCVFAGHSLGCAHTAFAAALAVRSGASVSNLELFAPPRFGDSQFHAGIAEIKTRAWRNGLDPVPEIPLGLPWTQFDLNMIYNPPQDAWDIFAWHSIDLYVRGMQ